MNETATGTVPADCHPKIRQIFDYWVSIHPPAGLPGRQHFDPSDVVALLPSVSLIDAPAPPGDLTFRLMGTQVEKVFGGNFTGKPFVRAYLKNHRSQAYIDIHAIVQDRLPRWRRSPAGLIANRDFVTIERVYLPLARDGASVDMILGLLLAKIGDGEFA